MNNRYIALIAACGMLLASGPLHATPMIWEPDFGAVLTDLVLEDDAETDVTLSFSFPFQGTSYTKVFVGTNGGLQLGSLGSDGIIDYSSWRDFGEFNDDGAPTIFPFNTDLDLLVNGTIHFNDFTNRAVFTWNEVGTFFTDDPLTFQVQLLETGTIIFGYNGILDGPGEGPLISLDEGILVGISLSNGADPGGVDLSVGPFVTPASTIYELWCYDVPNSCDGGRPGPINSFFDLDQENVLFTPQPGGGFLVDTVIPVPAAIWLFGSALGLLGWVRRRAN